MWVCDFILKYIFQFFFTLPLFMSRCHLLTLLYNICHTEHSQLSLPARYLSISFQNSILFFWYSFLPISFVLFYFRSFHLYPPVTNPVSTREAASNAMSEVSRALLVPFKEPVNKNELCALFNINKLHVNQFLIWIMSSSAVPAKKNLRAWRVPNHAHDQSLRT